MAKKKAKIEVDQKVRKNQEDEEEEQMSWGSVWIPFRDEAFSSLYGDVVWDVDIWNWKKEIPIPFQSSS